jgi:hypothetical protein
MHQTSAVSKEMYTVVVNVGMPSDRINLYCLVDANLSTTGANYACSLHKRGVESRAAICAVNVACQPETTCQASNDKVHTV